MKGSATPKPSPLPFPQLLLSPVTTLSLLVTTLTCATHPIPSTNRSFFFFFFFSRILEEWDRLTNQSETSSPEHSDNDMEGEPSPLGEHSPLGERSPVGEHSPLPVPGTPQFDNRYYQAGDAKDSNSVGGKAGSKGASAGTGKKSSARYIILVLLTS